MIDTITSRTVLRRAVAGQRRLVAGAAVLLMTWQACEAFVPVVIGAVIDHAITPHDGRAIAEWIGVLAGLFLVLSLSFRFGSRLSRQASEQAAHAARVAVAASVLDPDALPDPGRRTGTTVSIAGSDTDRVGAFCAVLPRTCGAVVSVLVAAAVLLRISVPLGLLVLIGCPILLVAVQLLGAPLERRSATEQAQAAEAAGLATDLLSGLRVLKGIGGEPAAIDRYVGASRRSLHATLRAARAEGLYDAVTLLLTMCFLALVALIGGRFAAAGRINVGDLVAAVGLAQFLIGPLSQLSATGSTLARARASAGRVAGVLAAPRRPASTGRLPEPVRGNLRLRTAHFELTVAAGELVGVAADPADANAIIEQLAAAPYADSQDVRIDDVAVGSLAADAAASALLVDRHGAHLFAETVLANVRAGQPEDGQGDHRIQAAILAADVDQVAETLPDGLRTVLTERGRSLSGGQRQRVALARALAADPAVLVLHDPTTAVDGATEARITTGLRRLRAGQSTIIVTTSPILLAACDRVLLVLEGQLRASGSHQQLSDQPDYRALVLA